VLGPLTSPWNFHSAWNIDISMKFPQCLEYWHFYGIFMALYMAFVKHCPLNLLCSLKYKWKLKAMC
jgi:hypothetical protein